MSVTEGSALLNHKYETFHRGIPQFSLLQLVIRDPERYYDALDDFVLG